MKAFRWRVASLCIPAVLASLGMEALRAQLPDLKPIDLQAPPFAAVGHTIKAEWEVINQGAIAATGEWGDDLWLSRGPIPLIGVRHWA